MSPMTRTSRIMNDAFGRRESTLARHPITGVLGLLLVTCIAATVLSMVPDFLRYMKLRRM